VTDLTEVSGLEVREKFARLFEERAGFKPDDVIWACYNEADRMMCLTLDNIETYIVTLNLPVRAG